MVQIIRHYEGNSNFSCSRWSDHKLHPTLEKSLHNKGNKNVNTSIFFRSVRIRRGYLLWCFLNNKFTDQPSENVFVNKRVFHLDFRISNSFSNLPEIWVQRWKHRVLAGMWRLQVGLSGWASLESWTDLPEVHPARRLQRGQLVASAASKWRTSEGKPSPPLLYSHPTLNSFCPALVSPVDRKNSTLE